MPVLRLGLDRPICHSQLNNVASSDLLDGSDERLAPFLALNHKSIPLVLPSWIVLPKHYAVVLCDEACPLVSHAKRQHSGFSGECNARGVSQKLAASAGSITRYSVFFHKSIATSSSMAGSTVVQRS